MSERVRGGESKGRKEEREEMCKLVSQRKSLPEWTSLSEETPSEES